MSEVIAQEQVRVGVPSASERLQEIERHVEHAAHLLPAQGPITVFVHHNTLHAFEDLRFDEAVRVGARTFNCHPYLPEDRYRRMLEHGRIRRIDLEAVLIADLGDSAHQLIGFLGTRFHLRQAMLQYPLLLGPAAELRWVITETDALRTFRHEAAAQVRERMIAETRRWVMRHLSHDGQPASSTERLQAEGGTEARDLIQRLHQLFGADAIDRWDESKWEAFCLHSLWRICRDGANHVVDDPVSRVRHQRHRDLLLEATAEDADRYVNEVLIRFCSAFLDQGLSDWKLPNREQGFYRSFIGLYKQPMGPPDRWFFGVRAELARLDESGVGPLKSIDQSLQALGVAADEREEFIAATMLALRGWAGMICQLETRGDRVAYPAPAGSLLEYLAIRLILERFALAHVAREHLDYRGPLHQLRGVLTRNLPHHQPHLADQRAFLLFQLAQVLGWQPEALSRQTPDEWRRVIGEVSAFSSMERRRIYHGAFERNFRNRTLDAVAIHVRQLRQERELESEKRRGAWGAEDDSSLSAESTASGLAERDVPRLQVLTCIDDREESFRRHIEEVEPRAETIGAAGFFGAAMYYRGNADAHYVPLCPIIVRPKHYVQEAVPFTFIRSDQVRRRMRQAIGSARQHVHLGSRTLAGGLLTGVLGSVATLPLVMRILLPRTTARLREMFGSIVQPPRITQLQLERLEETPGPHNGQIGFSLQEMTDIVERLLRDVGLTRGYARLIIICGHGSSSLNNPHESAYNCGACAGARGGPNARAVAQMANDPRVRQRLKDRGLPLPEDTVVVGAYHNTCDDSVTYFDLDRVPFSHRADLEHALEVIDEARARNAHERSRRFESAPLNLAFDAALRHVEGRAEDLSQARPEYNHATNALCFVGRRDWNRGLFLDRRAFLQSYDPAQDDDQFSILTRILQAVIPVCAGISLEYYFSCVDHIGWGAGNKLPHNVTSLLGVMDGAASDLRPGLYQQMIEIHEPMRLAVPDRGDARGDDSRDGPQRGDRATVSKRMGATGRDRHGDGSDPIVPAGKLRALRSGDGPSTDRRVVDRMVSRLARPSGLRSDPKRPLILPDARRPTSHPLHPFPNSS